MDEASGRTSGAVTCTFNIYDVTLDFDAGTATVIDVLSAGDDESVPLTEFLDRADSFGDRPWMGDGLTEMQRRPPTFAVDPHGDVTRNADA